MVATTAISTPSATQACARSNGNAAHTPIAATNPSSPIFTTSPVSDVDCGGGPGRRGGRAPTTSGADSGRAGASRREPPAAGAEPSLLCPFTLLDLVCDGLARGLDRRRRVSSADHRGLGLAERVPDRGHLRDRRQDRAV